MAKAITEEVFRASIGEIFDDVYSNVYKKDKHGYEYGYKLEQCGKLYRVKKNTFGVIDYQSGWLKLNEAQAIKKLMEVSEDGNS
jgi:hypothetical protein